MSRHTRLRTSGWHSLDVLRATALVVGFLLSLALLWVAREIVLTIFLGILFGLAVGSAAERFPRRGIPRGVGAGAVVFGFLLVLYAVGALIAPTLREQGRLLRERVPEAVDRIEDWVEARPGLSGLILGGRDVAPSPQAPVDTVTRTADTTAVPTLRERVTDQLSGTARYLFPFLSSTITVIVGVFLIIAIAIYVGADPDLYHRGLMKLFPQHARERAGEVLTRIASVLRKWLVTQLIAMASIAVVTTVVLWALGVKAAIALGLIAGVLEFVPTIGPILSAVPAVAMGFLDSPQKALYVLFAYLLIQQIEGHVLIPLLMKEGMDLPPALTIVAQAVMALLFGFLGLLVAVPMLAALMVPIKMLYVEGVIGEPPEEEDTASA
jgi:predicted PurR-regulated permease PerM